jgi:hypothetical protein
MKYFGLCIGYLQGFAFLWWLYLSHGVERMAWCILMCMIVRI